MSDIVERLLEPDRHDPECPFKNHCYCDGAPHDTVSHPLATEAAGAILALRKDVEAMKQAISDPNAVHVNMLRGGIARPSLAQIIHIYGRDAVSAALATEQTP